MNWIFEWLQRRCTHASASVRADILEGEDQTRMLQWCLRCGAYRFVHVVGPAAARVGDWHAPRATWA